MTRTSTWIGCVAADALEGAALQHAENFRLRGRRHVADFIQENRAVVALLEFADALDRRAGERAFFVAEQFAFQKLFGNRGAVHREERLFAAVAVMINRAGDEFLAGAAFAGDERGGVGGGNLADEFEHLLHRLAAADDAEFVILRFQQRLIGNDLLHVARGLERVGDDFLELGNVERLEQIIVGAELHRLDGRLRGAVGGHQNHEQLRDRSARMLRSVSRPVMPVMRTSISTRSGLNLGMTFSPSSPLAAVASSISGEAKIRWIEYRTSSSSSINSSLLICQRG